MTHWGHNVTPFLASSAGTTVFNDYADNIRYGLFTYAEGTMSIRGESMIPGPLVRKSLYAAPIVLLSVLLGGCLTTRPTTNATPTPALHVREPGKTLGAQERLLEAATTDGENLLRCHDALGQHGMTTAMDLVRCWGEPTRLAYQQSDLLIMDLVEMRLDVLYKAAVLHDNQELTSRQFWNTYGNQLDWFFDEIEKRLHGQASTSATTPIAVTTPAPRYYK
jgi:hypothetical protein